MKNPFRIKDDEGKLKPKNVFWLAIAFVVVFCIVYALVMFFCQHRCKTDPGTFGDMFGAVGALFSGLAFAGLIVTMLQQREDLKNQQDVISLQREDLKAQTEALRLQKEEIAQTNKELELQRSVMNEQNKTIMLQRFENTYFKMLEMQQKIVENLREDKIESNIRGRALIHFVYTLMNDDLIMLKVPGDRHELSEYLKSYYKHVASGVFDHYFGFLYRIVKFVDEYDTNILTKDDKYSYLCLLRAQLTKEELSILFYNCLSDYGKEKFKPLVERYALLQNIRPEFLFVPKHYEEYDSGAYKYKK